jgi:hypothetical protein
MSWMVKEKNNKPISNFRPEVLSVIRKHFDGNKDSELYVRVQLRFGKKIAPSKEFVVPESELNSIDWLSKDQRCRLNPEISPAKAQRYLGDAVRQTLPKFEGKEMEVFYINRLGTHIIKGVPGFCTGNEMIWPRGMKEKPLVEIAPLPYRLATDSNISELETAAGMFEYMSLSPDPLRVMVSQKLLYLMRHVYESVWHKSPCVIVLIHGLTNSKKTSTAALTFQLHNLDEGIKSPQRLNNSIPAAETLLFEKEDCCVVLDDLFPTKYKDKMKETEEVFFEITRIVADGVARGRVGNPNSGKAVKVGVCFTSEYIVGIGSDASRVFPVEMSPAPDGAALRKFQDDPQKYLGSFYYNFVQFYISRYFEIQAYLKEYKNSYQELKISEFDRLNETHFFLSSSYAVLMQYCTEIGYTTHKEANELFASFFELLTVLVKEQQIRVKQGISTGQGGVSESKESGYLEKLSKLYRSGCISLAPKAKDFKKGDMFDGVVHDECLCIRSTKFERVIRDVNITDNKERVIRSLLSQGTLRRSKDRLTIQLSSTGGKRFYAIPIEKL